MELYQMMAVHYIFVYIASTIATKMPVMLANVLILDEKVFLLIMSL